jgi:hypothetical protein
MAARVLSDGTRGTGGRISPSTVSSFRAGWAGVTKPSDAGGRARGCKVRAQLLILFRV